MGLKLKLFSFDHAREQRRPTPESLSVGQARELRRRWLAAWPEMARYFEWMSELTCTGQLLLGDDRRPRDCE